MCNNSHHFPLCLGRHTGITVHQRLSWLWECVGDTVTETLAQTSSGTKRRRECITFIVPAHTACYIQLHAQSTPTGLTYHVPQVKHTRTLWSLQLLIKNENHAVVRHTSLWIFKETCHRYSQEVRLYTSWVFGLFMIFIYEHHLPYHLIPVSVCDYYLFILVKGHRTSGSHQETILLLVQYVSSKGKNTNVDKEQCHTSWTCHILIVTCSLF